MCTIAFALQPTPAIALLVAANRDETRSRPTLSAGVWRDEAGRQILSGRDLQDGGTWMGCAHGGAASGGRTCGGIVESRRQVDQGPPGLIPGP